MSSMLLDGYAVRDMWAGGDNSQAQLRGIIEDGTALLLADDSDLYQQPPELKQLAAKAKRALSTQSTTIHAGEVAFDNAVSDEDYDRNASHFEAIAVASRKKIKFITSAQTASGERRIDVAGYFNVDANCWRNAFDI